VTIEEILRLCANYGFPMVVAMYLLIRIEPVLKELRDSVRCLTTVIAQKESIDLTDTKKLEEVLVSTFKKRKE